MDNISQNQRPSLRVPLSPDAEWTEAQHVPTSLAVSNADTMDSYAPTMVEITQLTRQLLTTATESDPIRECGRTAVALLPSGPDMCQELAYQKLHDVPYREVKTCWRRLYTDATLWKIVELVGRHEKSQDDKQNESLEEQWIDEVVKMLDMVLILTGAPMRGEVVELWFSALNAYLHPGHVADMTECNDTDRPTKKRKVSPNNAITALPSSFPAVLPTPADTLQCPIPRTKELSMSIFQSKISAISGHAPIIIEAALEHWPALHERPWRNPSYLLQQTLGGRRLVPIEVGASYTDSAWGQKIITFRDFMSNYMLSTNSSTPSLSEETPQKGYLAQHDLFAQIPSLRADISIPDYCYCTPAPSPHLTHIKPVATLEEPLLNAWFGPAGTVSPLHTDPYHNILAQVVGYKYIRLYAPTETERLYPRSVDEKGVDMSNTSLVDVDEARRMEREVGQLDANGTLEVESARKEFDKNFPGFLDAEYVEGVLAPGECLYLPVGWWHYIRSLTPSFSVSFWFN
jgi:hypothetical protein